MKPTTAVVAIICAAIAGLVTPIFASDAQETYLQGLQAYNAGKTDEALKAWSDVLSTKPDSDTTQSKAITALIDLVQDLTKKVDELQSQLNKTSTNPQTTSSTGGSDAATLTLKELKIVNSRGEVVMSLGYDPVDGIAGAFYMYDPTTKKTCISFYGGGGVIPAGINLTRAAAGSLSLFVMDDGGAVYVKDNNNKSVLLSSDGLH